MVVVVSGYPAKDHELSALDAGAFAYLEKSAIRSGLAERLRTMYDRHCTGPVAAAPDRSLLSDEGVA